MSERLPGAAVPKNRTVASLQLWPCHWDSRVRLSAHYRDGNDTHQLHKRPRLPLASLVMDVGILPCWGVYASREVCVLVVCYGSTCGDHTLPTLTHRLFASKPAGRQSLDRFKWNACSLLELFRVVVFFFFLQHIFFTPLSLALCHLA